MSVKQIPRGALSLHANGSQALAHTDDDGENASMEMTVYSGGVIKDHFYWGDLAIDLEGMKIPSGVHPILEEHMTSRKIAFGKPVIEDHQLRFDPKSIKLLDTDAANEFVKNSKAGFPFQSSVFAEPDRIETLEEGTSAEVNGFTMQGPGTIWRGCEFKEGSVCVFGYDPNTQSQALSKEVVDLEVEETTIQKFDKKSKEVKKRMDLETLKKDHPDLVKSIEEAAAKVATEAAETAFNVKLEAQKKAAENDKKTMEERMEGLEKTNLELQKTETLRSERELSSSADTLWSAKLTNSEIPVHLHDKVRKHVAYTGFMKEGKLDSEAFAKAIDDEIKSWEEDGVTTENVMGSGSFSPRSSEDSSAVTLAKENQDAADRLLKLAGQEQKKDQT